MNGAGNLRRLEGRRVVDVVGLGDAKVMILDDHGVTYTLTAEYLDEPTEQRVMRALDPIPKLALTVATR